MERYLVTEICEVKDQPELLFVDLVLIKPKVEHEFCSIHLLKSVESLKVEFGDELWWEGEVVSVPRSSRDGFYISKMRRVGPIGPVLTERPEGIHG